MVRRNLASSLIEAMDVAARQEAVVAKSWRLFQEVGRARLRPLPGVKAHSAPAIAGGGGKSILSGNNAIARTRGPSLAPLLFG
jgi:hypothetical protein